MDINEINSSLTNPFSDKALEDKPDKVSIWNGQSKFWRDKWIEFQSTTLPTPGQLKDANTSPKVLRELKEKITLYSYIQEDHLARQQRNQERGIASSKQLDLSSLKCVQKLASLLEEKATQLQEEERLKRPQEADRLRQNIEGLIHQYRTSKEKMFITITDEELVERIINLQFGYFRSDVQDVLKRSA